MNSMRPSDKRFIGAPLSRVGGMGAFDAPILTD